MCTFEPKEASTGVSQVWEGGEDGLQMENVLLPCLCVCVCVARLQGCARSLVKRMLMKREPAAASPPLPLIPSLSACRVWRVQMRASL